MDKCCLIYNLGMHYRLPIFKKMWEVFKCDFYFGDKIHTPIKKFDYRDCPGFVKELKNKYWGLFYWQKGSLGLLFKPYKNYIIIGEPYNLSSWIILLFSKITSKRIIGWTHGWYGDEIGIKRWIKRIYFSSFDELLVYGEYAIDLMTKEGIPTQKMHCMANSLDSDKILKIRQNLKPNDIYINHFKNNYPVVLYSGRIQKVKKLNLLLEAIANLKVKGFLVNAVIVGNDVENVNLKALAQKINVLNQVWLYGACYDEEELSRLFVNTSVCVSPGNVGLTAIHSLSYGCPVITHNNFAAQMPEFEAVIPSATGDFFKQGDVEGLAECIKRWCSLSEEEREKTRAACYAEIDRKWNVDYQIGVLKEVLL